MSTITISAPRTLAPVRTGQVRLTRRGRLVVFTTGLLVVLLAFVFLGAGSVATERGGDPVSTTTVMVAPGDTLWSIASAVTPAGGDVRDAMFDIKRLNRLESSALVAGQRLRVPAAD